MSRCEFCAKTFTRKEHMVNHVRKHTGETPHRCDICKKSFTRKEHFMNHVMWHTGIWFIKYYSTLLIQYPRVTENGSLNKLSLG